MELEKNDRRLAGLMASGNGAGGSLVSQWVKSLVAIRELLGEFEEREILIKDLDRGLIDFPSLIGDKEVLLCWEKDEDDIEFWHDIDSGFAGRGAIVRSGSITPIAIDFVDVDFAAGEIFVVRKIKRAGGAVEGKRGGLRRVIGIVSGETDYLFRFAGDKQQDGVIDAERREANEMNDRRAIVFDVGDELFGLALLETVGEWHHDAPVSALKITLPRAAALFLQQGSLRGAEGVQIGVAGNDDFFGFGREFSRCSNERRDG